MIKYAKTLINDWISTVYPANCINCSDILVKNENYLCTGCYLGLPRTNYHEKPDDNPLFNRFVHNPFVEEAYCLLHFNQGGVAQMLLHELKYKNRPNVGNFLGTIYAQDIKSLKLDYDLILPVPIHWKKIKKRGYNQSDHIAEGLATELNIPVGKDYLVKSSLGSSQTKKTKVERWQNVASTFRIQKPSALVGKKILLVDDVITTGATVSELCEELIKCEVDRIGICAIASGIK